MKRSVHSAVTAPAPVGGYAQAVKVVGAEELVFISGQVPVDAEGRTPPAFSDQAALCWRHVFAQLEAAGLTREHLVKVTIFLSDRRYAVDNRAARAAALGDHPVALTVIISGIFDPAWLLEIEAVAAR